MTSTGSNHAKPSATKSPRNAGCLALAAIAGLYLGTATADQPDGNYPLTSHALEFYVSEYAFQALYLRPMDLGEVRTTHANLGIFLNEERDLVGSLDALLELEIGNRSRWTAQVGPRAYAALMNTEETDVFSVALGGRLQYQLTRQGAAVSIGGFYAPSILTFGEADNVYDVHVRVEVPLRDTMQIFLGYRHFQWNMTTGPVDDPLSPQNRKLDDGIHLGVRAAF